MTIYIYEPSVRPLIIDHAFFASSQARPSSCIFSSETVLSGEQKKCLSGRWYKPVKATSESSLCSKCVRIAARSLVSLLSLPWFFTRVAPKEVVINTYHNSTVAVLSRPGLYYTPFCGLASQEWYAPKVVGGCELSCKLENTSSVLEIDLNLQWCVDDFEKLTKINQSVAKFVSESADATCAEVAGQHPFYIPENEGVKFNTKIDEEMLGMSNAKISQFGLRLTACKINRLIIKKLS